MNREEVCLRPQFKRVLRLYGFDDPNSFLFDSCPESSTTTTTQPMPPVSVTTEGTVITEITPTSQVIQISTNITNGSASEISTVVTEFPAKVTYLGDASFTISNINTNVINTSPSSSFQTDMMQVDIETQPHIRPIESSTNQQGITDSINDEESKSSNEVKDISNKPNKSIKNTSPSMNFQTDTMVIDIDTQPHIRPIESSTNQQEGTTVSINEEEPKSPVNEIEVINEKLNKSIVAETIVASTTPIISNDPTMTAAATVTEIMSMDYSSSTIYSQTEKLINTTSNSELDTLPIETTTSTAQLHEKTTDSEFYTNANSDIFDIKDVTTLSSNSYATSTKNKPDNTVAPSTESTLQTVSDETSNMMNGQHVLVENTVETMMSTTNKLTAGTDEATESIATSNTIEIILSTKPMFNDDSATKEFQTNTIPITMTDQTTPITKSELNNKDIITSSENPIYTTDVSSTVVNSSAVNENEIINEAESNQNYQIAFLDKKTARSMESKDLPTFNVEFVVRKEDIQVDCNQTKKTTFIKPDRILTEYPKNSGISVKLRESKKRRRRYLDQCNLKNIYLLITYIPNYT